VTGSIALHRALAPVDAVGARDRLFARAPCGADWRSHRRRHINLQESLPPSTPALESVVRPVDLSQITSCGTALEQLAERITHFAAPAQRRGEISVRLYGEVQKEVVMKRWRVTTAIDATFDRADDLHRASGWHGRARRVMETTKSVLTRRLIPLRTASLGAASANVRELGSLPLAFYRRLKRLCTRHLARVVRLEVTDCVVTLTQTGFSSVLSTASDFAQAPPSYSCGRSQDRAKSCLGERDEQSVTPSRTTLAKCLVHSLFIARFKNASGNEPSSRT